MCVSPPANTLGIALETLKATSQLAFSSTACTHGDSNTSDRSCGKQHLPACMIAMPLTATPQPAASSTCLHAGNGKGGEGGYLRLISTLQTGTGPAFELHGPRVAKRIRHAHQ